MVVRIIIHEMGKNMQYCFGLVKHPYSFYQKAHF